MHMICPTCTFLSCLTNCWFLGSVDDSYNASRSNHNVIKPLAVSSQSSSFAAMSQIATSFAQLCVTTGISPQSGSPIRVQTVGLSAEESFRDLITAMSGSVPEERSPLSATAQKFGPDRARGPYGDLGRITFSVVGCSPGSGSGGGFRKLSPLFLLLSVTGSGSTLE